MTKAVRIWTAIVIGLGLASFGPAGEALYLSLTRHPSAAFVGFWVVAWAAIAYGTAWRLAQGREMTSE